MSTGTVPVGVAALIFKNGKLLLMKRTGSHGAGTWAPPGGWVEPGEFLTQTCKREVREELGINITAWDPCDYTENFHPDGLQDICFWMPCSMDPPDQAPIVMEPDRATELRWFTHDEILDLGEDELFTPLGLFRDLAYLDRAFEDYGRI